MKPFTQTITNILVPNLRNSSHLIRKSTMTSSAVFTAVNLPPLSFTNNRAIPPIPFHYSPTFRKNSNNNKRSNLPHRIKSSATREEEEQDIVKIGARVRVRVPLKVYHVPKVQEVELHGKEGRIKENVAVWRGKHISANFPYKIEFFETLEGRDDAPVNFFAHLKDDEFDYID